MITDFERLKTIEQIEVRKARRAKILAIASMKHSDQLRYESLIGNGRTQDAYAWLIKHAIDRPQEELDLIREWYIK